MHLALYRKWRSVSFDDVAGQDHVTSVLKYEAANGMISHAYLFSGPRGTGKTSCAKILSRAVNCEDPQNGNPCNKCASCRSILSGASVDVIEMDAASNNGVDNIRDIRDEVMFTPAESKYRVYIVDEVHMLSPSAFNALLKTLEEPPSHVIFILATTELHKLPETVISRCQRFDFRRLSVPVISKRLEYISKNEGFDVTSGALDEIARLAEGGMRDAISLLELCAGRHTLINEELVSDVLGTLGYEKVAAIANAIAKKDYDSIFSVIAGLTAQGRDISVFWDELTAFFRDMLIVKTTRSPENFLDISSSAMELLKNTASEFSIADVLYNSRLLDDTSAVLSRAPASKRITAELALVKMCDASLDTGNDALLKRISALEDAVKLLSVGQRPGAISSNSDPSDAAPKTSSVMPKSGISDISERSPSASEEKITDKSGSGNENSLSYIKNESQPLLYWGELLSKAAEKNHFIDGFRQFISARKTSSGFEVICSNPFTYKICSDNKKLFVELISVFEGTLVSEKEVSITQSTEMKRAEAVSLDDF